MFFLIVFIVLVKNSNIFYDIAKMLGYCYGKLLRKL